MKTSNKIIVYFLTLAWLSIIATLLISSGFASNRLYKIASKVNKETYALQDFSVIQIMEASNLRLFSGDTNQLEYDEVSGGDIKPPKAEPIQDFTVKNDTLFIDNLRNASNGGYTLRVRNLKHLIVSNTSNIELIGFNQDSLIISSENSGVAISKNSGFSFLYLKSEPKYDLTFRSAKEFSLSLTEDNCKVLGEIEEISGIIGNYAELEIPRKTEKVEVDTSFNGKIDYVFK